MEDELDLDDEISLEDLDADLDLNEEIDLEIQKRQPEKVMPQRKYQKKQIRLKNKHYRKLSE